MKWNEELVRPFEKSPAVSGAFLYMTTVRQNIGNMGTLVGGMIILAGLAYLAFYWLRIILTFLEIVGVFVRHHVWLMCLLVLGTMFLVVWRRRRSNTNALNAPGRKL